MEKRVKHSVIKGLHCISEDPINADIEMRDAHEAEADHQNMSMEDNPGFESIDEVDGALPLAGAQEEQPMEAAVTVSCLQNVIFYKVLYHWLELSKINQWMQLL